MSSRKELEPWQKEDAERLKTLYAERVKKRGISQMTFGDDYDLGTQGNVWQYLNARTPLNLSVAIRFAQGIGCSVADFSPTLASDLARLNGVANSADEHTILAAFRAADPTAREIMLSTARTVLGSPLAKSG